MRTTVDIDDPILREIKAIHKQEGRSMGAVVSALLADALALRQTRPSPLSFDWTTRAMNARIDLADKDALYASLDGQQR
jgi:hypothetical protein